MAKIGQNAKNGQIWRPVAPQPYVVQKSWPISGTPCPWTTTVRVVLQRGVHSISLQCIPWPVACSEWGTLFDRLSISDFGGKWPLSETFRKCLSGFIDGTSNYVSCPNMVKIGRCKVAERSHRLPHKKTRVLRDSSLPPFCPKWVDRAQNSLNVVTPWLVHVYGIWSGCVLSDLFRKDWFFGQKSQ